MIEGDPLAQVVVTLPTQEQKSPRSALWSILFFILMSTAFFAVVVIWVGTLAPKGESRDVMVTIPKGSTVPEIADVLLREGVIRNEKIFVLVVRLKGLDTALPSGEFLFRVPKDLSLVVAQLGRHDRGIAQVRITIPEGLTAKQMLPILGGALPRFQSDEFFEKAKNKEGYLFPDTYFFFSTATSGAVLTALEENFLLKTKSLYEESIVKNKKWADIVVMASIIEEEAVVDADRRLVSGILWNRIKKGMRLQVDASFAYLMNKASSEITIDDLNNDSPYNTYRHGGLPPAPIANPGLAAIEAALHPTESTYLYYLSDEDGKMHYAKTFEEHKLNKAKYLR
jgi:UPF0755 protein